MDLGTIPIKVKYFHEDCKLEKNPKGDWIDVRVRTIKINGKNVQPVWDNKYRYDKGDVVKVYLGFAMELPKNCEALLAPRSTTFDKWNLIQTNSIGIVDNTYCGDDDEWKQQFIAMGPGEIEVGDKVGQFRILGNQAECNFVEVKKLGNKNRGQGVTGRK